MGDGPMDLRHLSALRWMDAIAEGHFRGVRRCPAKAGSFSGRTTCLATRALLLTRRTRSLTQRARSLARRTTRLAPRTRSLTRRTTRLAPRTTGLAPRTTTLAPRTTGLAPRTTGLAPRTTGLASRTTGLAARARRFPALRLQLGAPGVRLAQVPQSTEALSVSAPFGRRQSERVTVLLSAVANAVPSTRLTVPTPGRVAAVTLPS